MQEMINMDKDFSKALQGFDKVWHRVQQAKPRENSAGAKNGRNVPMPPKRNGSRARRFEP